MFLNHSRMGFENAVAVYSFLAVEKGCPHPHVSYFLVFVLPPTRSARMIGRGRRMNSRTIIHIVEMLPDSGPNVASDRPKVTSSVILAPTIGEVTVSMNGMTYMGKTP